MHSGHSKRSAARCYLLRPGDPDTTQQSGEEEGLDSELGKQHAYRYEDRHALRETWNQ